jgi:hypothetical protein
MPATRILVGLQQFFSMACSARQRDDRRLVWDGQTRWEISDLRANGTAVDAKYERSGVQSRHHGGWSTHSSETGSNRRRIYFTFDSGKSCGRWVEGNRRGENYPWGDMKRPSIGLASDVDGDIRLRLEAGDSY